MIGRKKEELAMETQRSGTEAFVVPLATGATLAVPTSRSAGPRCPAVAAGRSCRAGS